MKNYRAARKRVNFLSASRSESSASYRGLSQTSSLTHGHLSGNDSAIETTG